MLNNLIATQGFPSAVRATGYLIVACLVASNLLIATRLPPPKLRSEEMHMPKPDMKTIFTDKAYLSVMAGSFLMTWGFTMPFFYIQRK